LLKAEAFFERVRSRLEQGERDYGNKSFHRPYGKLLDEIQQELEDVCGWSAILWSRLQRLRDELTVGVQRGEADDDGA
jgi:hypothetical protein